MRVGEANRRHLNQERETITGLLRDGAHGFQLPGREPVGSIRRNRRCAFHLTQNLDLL